MTNQTPLHAVHNATLRHKLAEQQSRIQARLEYAERVTPSRERAAAARRAGYYGPLTRRQLELSKVVS